MCNLIFVIVIFITRARLDTSHKAIKWAILAK